MAYPKQHEIEIPLLEVINKLGGKAKPKDVYPKVSDYFPQLTDDEKEEKLENYPSTKKWNNLVQWVRQRLVDSGDLDGTERGVWKITIKGMKRVNTTDSKNKVSNNQITISVRDLFNDNMNDIKNRIMSELKDLTPREFEVFCKKFLLNLGFIDVEVTKRSQDGGIDGFGQYKQGAVSIKSAFQAKRWTDNNVGRPEIDKFRGAIQGDFDHGVFLTTSRFTKDARASSYKKGAITILLLDLKAIADIMVERGMGVRKTPIYIYDIDDDFFDIEE